MAKKQRYSCPVLFCSVSAAVYSDWSLKRLSESSEAAPMSFPSILEFLIKNLWFHLQLWLNIAVVNAVGGRLTGLQSGVHTSTCPDVHNYNLIDENTSFDSSSALYIVFCISLFFISFIFISKWYFHLEMFIHAVFCHHTAPVPSAPSYRKDLST